MPTLHHWQQRIREGDTTTPWWYPSETTGGSMAAARLALPIPPGTHWSDAKPMVLPGMEQPDEVKTLPSPRKAKASPVVAPVKPKTHALGRGGLVTFSVPTPPAPAVEKKVREKKPKVMAKNDPRLVAAAREMRDRWLEHVNSGQSQFDGAGKYDVSRMLTTGATGPTGLLPAA